MSESVKKIGNMTVKVISGNDVSLQNKIISRNDAEMDRRAEAAVQSAIDRARIGVFQNRSFRGNRFCPPYAYIAK